MTLQGLNITVAIYRREQESDDDIGGSKQRRTPIRTGIPGRIGNLRSPMSLRLQGLENINMYDCNVQSPDYTDLDIQIDDIVVPESGQYTGEDFVVKAIQDDTLRDNFDNQDYRYHKFLSLQRVEIARRVQ